MHITLLQLVVDESNNRKYLEYDTSGQVKGDYRVHIVKKMKMKNKNDLRQDMVYYYWRFYLQFNEFVPLIIFVITKTCLYFGKYTLFEYQKFKNNKYDF
jgi:hypothetical protein